MLIVMLICWILMAAAASAAGLYIHPASMALAAWAGFALMACLIGALLIWLQPTGQSTLLGRLGYAVTHWGFRAGHGRLPFAVGISWLVWMGVGGAAIGIVHGRHNWQLILAIIGWTIDGAMLMYLLGMLLRNRSANGGFQLSLSKGALVFASMLGVSLGMWHWGGEPWRNMAVMIALGPPVAIGGVYGLFLLLILLMGKKVRWN